MKKQIEIIKVMGMKPNFSELARIYSVDRRTVKKYYEGYEGKAKKRNKPSKLDKYYDEIKLKLSIKGVTIRAVYEKMKDDGLDVGTYSNFSKYVKRKEMKPEKSVKGHPRFETLEGLQAQVDWKEDIKLYSKTGGKFEFNVFSYKLGYSRYCYFEYRKEKTQQDVFECLISAFKQTGGVPKEILFDNMGTVVDINGTARKINNKMRSFARVANFPFLKGTEDFDFQPAINKQEILDLKSLRFVENKENILFVGTPGVGKTHLAVSIAIEAAKHRYSTYFINFYDLMSQLKKALLENRLEIRLKHFAKYKVLVIDVIGYLPIDNDSSNLFFQLISERYEKHSTIITTNTPFSDWQEIFGTPMLAQAILDRLLHHSHVISIKGESYRLKEKLDLFSNVSNS